jgi:hypothetical protein
MPTNQIFVSLTQFKFFPWFYLCLDFLPLKNHRKVLYIKSAVFWDVASYFPIEVFRRFGATYCLRIHGRRVSRPSNPAWLNFNPENEDSTFLRNVGKLLPNCILSHSKKTTIYEQSDYRGCGLHLCVSKRGPVASSPEHGIETSATMNGVE